MSFLGMGNVTSNLRRIERQFESATLDGMLEIGEKGVGIWKRNTPVVSGRLRNSESYTIANKVYADGGNASDNIRASSDDKTLYIGTNVVYGPSVEYLSKTGSKGFTFRSYKTLLRSAENILANAYRKGIK